MWKFHIEGPASADDVSMASTAAVGGVFPSGKRYPDWPKVDCSTCGHQTRGQNIRFLIIPHLAMRHEDLGHELALRRRDGLLGGSGIPGHREQKTDKHRQGPASTDGPCKHLRADIATAGIMTSELTVLVVMKPDSQRGSRRGALSPVKYACSSLVSMLGRTPSRFCTYKTQNPSTE